ncbi:MAG: yesS, partial [Neobacillus sp.]|nr:yesS [Neobacillus sp.]
CIIKATNYIEENYRELTSIADIANHSHISREHLSRLFKNYYGTTINNYINQKRINESKRLFELGANVTEACFSSGFNNVSYFIKIFHQKVGTTPLEYKHFINIPS